MVEDKQCDFDKPSIQQVAWVFEKIVENGELPGTFRKLIYDFMGFGPEAYEPLYLAGGMTIINSFFTSNEPDENSQFV